VSPQEVKFQFTWQASYDLPVGKGRAFNLNGVANAALGGWTINGIPYLSDGIPINAPGCWGRNFSYFNQRTNLSCNPSKGAPHTASSVVPAQLLHQSRQSLRRGNRARVSR
jgi:hypothetical protein